LHLISRIEPMKLSNYLSGEWSQPSGEGEPLLDPVRGTELARVSSAGVDYGQALNYSRTKGGPALRALTYAKRARLLGQIADVLGSNRDTYYRIALENSGSSKADAAIDIDGAIFTLKHYAREGESLGENHLLCEGSLVRLGKSESFQGLHIGLALRGVAVLINAFNFPSWGMWEKAAPALLSGVPVLVKPATATAWLAHRMVEDVIKAACLPEGALSIVCGSAADLLDHVTGTDAIAFTGSAETAQRIRTHAAVARHSARVNIEADSLNVAVLGPDAAPGDGLVDLLIAEVVREMTVKAGQKCTAIRRILVPEALFAAVAAGLQARLSEIRVGDPREAGTQMGPLVSKRQQRSVLEGIQRLAQESRVIFGLGPDFTPAGVDPAVAAFIAPTLFAQEAPLDVRAVHEVEVFGPVATLLPYRSVAEAVQIAELGRGSLVASIFTEDPRVRETLALELAPSHGRIHAVSSEVAGTHTGHGNVMPMSLHGGPGRAGGGQELGGMRALRFYHQFTALQGPARSLESLAQRATELRPR
jgi:3,4-dehydroadipyl-CoA semialdehyde dehydrogenase